MKEIDYIPTILTSDEAFVEAYKKTPWKPGQIILLPEDAILIQLPTPKPNEREK